MAVPRSLLLAALAAVPACMQSPRLDHAPADTAFTIGVIVDGGNIPQSSSAVKLRFVGGGKIPPGTVVAQRVSSPMAIDGDAADWGSIPPTAVKLISPGQILGMSLSDWYCEYQTRSSYPRSATSAANCSQPCDPNAKPQTADDANQYCTTPLPKYEYPVSEARVRVAYDDERIYFLVQWNDATESRQRRPWVWDPAAGATGTGAWVTDATKDEDKVFLSFDIDQSFPAHDAVGCAAACHVKAAVAWPPPGTYSSTFATQYPDYATKWAMHTTQDSERVDGWTWRASRDVPGAGAFVDDQNWNSRTIVTDCKTPFVTDTVPVSCVADCLHPPATGSTCTSDGPLGNSASGLPMYLAKGGGAGDPDLSPSYLYLADPSFTAFDPHYEALQGLVAATTTTPASFPAASVAGATLPATVLKKLSKYRDDVTAQGRWSCLEPNADGSCKTGQWSVEFSRALVTGDPNDAQFPLR